MRQSTFSGNIASFKILTVGYSAAFAGWVFPKNRPKEWLDVVQHLMLSYLEGVLLFHL